MVDWNNNSSPHTVLHADELCPSVLLRDVVHHLELPCPHRASTQISHFAHSDEVVESFHGFFDGRAGIESVDLEEIDVVGPETFEGRVNLVEDGLTTESGLVHVVPSVFQIAHCECVGRAFFVGQEIAFCEDDEAFSWDVVLCSRKEDVCKTSGF